MNRKKINKFHREEFTFLHWRKFNFNPAQYVFKFDNKKGH